MSMTQSETLAAEQFAETLQSAGFVLEGLPSMDGRGHRVPVMSAHGHKNMDGWYVGFLNGWPAGSFQNHKIHSEPQRWKMVRDGRATLSAGFAPTTRVNSCGRGRAHELHSEEDMEAAAKRAYGYFCHALPVNQDHRYLSLRQLDEMHHPAIRVKDGNLLVPMFNQDGQLRNITFISENGEKHFLKGGQVRRLFSATVDLFASRRLPASLSEVYLAEGYATAMTIGCALGIPVFVSFGANNILEAGRALKAFYPSSRLVLVADNDFSNPYNKGIDSANTAAAVLDALVISPSFADEDKGLSDFNDFYCKYGFDKLCDELAAAMIAATAG